MVDHIAEYQNKFSFANLFIHNIVALLQSGIMLNDIFSTVFTFKIEFNEWPSLHQIEENIVLPYNESPCDLRYKYKSIFNELESRVAR